MTRKPADIPEAIAPSVLRMAVFEIPADLAVLEKAEPIYEWFPGWQQSTQDARTLADLPAALAERARDRAPQPQEVLRARQQQLRAVARRAERAVLVLHESGEPVPEVVRLFFNRLSDLLWILARVEDA